MTDHRASDKQSRPWFGNKRYGVGIRPQTWQGWTITAVFIVAVIVIVYFVGH